jgi:hypothetical protein
MDASDRHDDWDDRPWQCVECGTWNYPDDGEFVRTDAGPVCCECAGVAEAVIA